MTVPTTARRAGPYSGNGSTTTFSFSFKTFASTDLQVTKTGTNGLDTVLIKDSDYSVSLNADQAVSPGGTITYPISGTALATGEKLVIVGNLAYEQTTDLLGGGAFNAQVIEDTFDRTVIQIQQLEERADRAITIPVSSTASGALPAPEAAKIIGWNQGATGLSNYDPATFVSAAYYADWVYQTFTGNGTTTSFVLTKAPGSLANMDVTIAGVSQVPSADFMVSGTTLTFTSAPPNGSTILVRYGQAAQQHETVFTTYNATATASQTVFNLVGATYVPGANNLAVYVNGLRMVAGADYIETDADTVTFNSGLTLGDEVSFVCGRELSDATGAEQVSFVPAGTSAVARTVESKLRDVVSVKDFGAVGNGVANDTAAIQAAINAVASAGGGTVLVPKGSYICTTTITLKIGVNLVGEGTVHHAFYVNPAYTKTGSVLLVTGPASGDCIKFEGNVKGHFGIYNLSVFDNGSAAIRSVCNISGVLHPRLEDVEFACVGTARGVGLLISNEPAVPPFSGQAITLYGVFRNVNTINVRDGIHIQNDCNSNVFLGGTAAGTRYSLYMTGTYALPLANCFSGVAFESSWNASTQDIAYVAGAANIHGWVKHTNAYVAKFVKIEKARGTMFSGCYFENGGMPATYNDGTNGTLNIAAVVALDAATATDVNGTDFHACSWNNFLFDKGLRTTADTLPFTSSYTTLAPASLIRRKTSNQTIPAYSHVAVDMSGQDIFFEDATIDYDSSTKTATFKQRGTYSIKATLMFSAFAGASDFVYARLIAAGYTFYGPNVVKASGTQDVGLTVECVVPAVPGNTVVLEVFQSSGVDQTLLGSADRTYWSIVKIS